MQSRTPPDRTIVSTKRKRLHGSVTSGHMPDPSLQSQVEGDITSKSSPRKVVVIRSHSTTISEPAITSGLDMCHLDASRSGSTPEIPETPQREPSLSPSASSQRHDMSPSLTASTLWWDETEITGHDPKDPNDDGYGINGVGFIPTPAIERARIELRKRQIAAWKVREAKEARQERSDRRRHRDSGFRGRENILGPLSKHEMKQVKKVRFLGA